MLREEEPLAGKLIERFDTAHPASSGLSCWSPRDVLWCTSTRRQECHKFPRWRMSRRATLEQDTSYFADREVICLSLS